MARLLAEALKAPVKSAGNFASSACPDPELLAAYADRGLTEEEAARWESHFADCSRCQKIIAVLVASDDELTEAEVERSGNLAAASMGASAARKPAEENAEAWWRSIWRRPTVWRWLVPAAGLASAVGLWFALHQAPSRETLSAQKITATAEAPQNAAGAASTKSDENEIAQANLPSPPESAPRSDVLLRDKEAAQAKSLGAARQEAAKKQEASNALRAPQVAGSGGTANTREYDAKDNRLQSAQAAEQRAITDALSAGAPAAPVAAPPPPAPPARQVDRAERQSPDGAAGATVTTQMKALAQTVSPAAIFASPSRRSLWRLGSAGRLERSTDQGQTWQPQSSGVAADLLAGAAPSDTVAWVVGRGETILRTEDGERWQRVAPPPFTQDSAAATPVRDWISVEARDALHATITSRDLRRFATADGGRTWVQVQ